MAVHFLNQPTGSNITFDPNPRFDLSGLSMLAEQARKNRQIQSDRQTLRQIMGIPEPEQPTGLRGVMSRLGGLFGAGPENQPVGDLAKAVTEAKLKQIGQEWKPQTEEAYLRTKRAEAGIKEEIQPVRERIFKKIEQGKSLSAGEQKLYDTVLSKQPKGESFSEQQRADIQSSVEKIRNGESNYQVEKKNLLSKYPSIGWNTLQNLSDIEKMYKPEITKRQTADRQLQKTAIQELKKAGYPVTENNINNAIEQLRGQ